MRENYGKVTRAGGERVGQIIPSLFVFYNVFFNTPYYEFKEMQIKIV